MSNIDKLFQPKFFSNSDVNNILLDSEQKMLVIDKNSESESIYTNFYNDLSTYISKLSNNSVKSQVQNLLNKDLIYLGLSKTKIDNIFSRLLITTDNKLAGIVLDTQQLAIDPITGSCESADECTYAVYFGLVRAAVVLNKDEIRKDKDLHKLMTTYLYLLLLKAVGIDKIYSEKFKVFIHILAIYMYYKYYLKEKHNFIISILENDYEPFIGKKNIEEFLPTIEKFVDYQSIKDFPKMLIDAKLWTENPNIITIALLKTLKPTGFYCLLGPLDYFVSLAVVSKYPVEFFSKKSLVNEKLQDAIEEIIVKYINKIKYDLSVIQKKK